VSPPIATVVAAVTEGPVPALWQYVDALMAVTKFVQHRAWCARLHGDASASCDCGLESALREARESREKLKTILEMGR